MTVSKKSHFPKDGLLIALGIEKFKKTPAPRLKDGVPMKPAKCLHCGHSGKSQHPEYYLCTGCWNSAKAESLTEQVRSLLARVDKLEKEASVHLAKADAFRKRHPKRPR
jgi:tRNA(Ile2) C34 agmatinyltransferase TiaS